MPVTASVEMPLVLNLKQLYLGDAFEVEYVRETLCTNWRDCVSRSSSCQGPGVRVRTQQLAPGFVQQVQVRDDRCVGKGESWKKDCRACPSGKTQPEKTVLSVDVTPGMRSGERVVFEGVADEKVGMTPGDLSFVVKESAHPVFKRDGDNLFMTVEVPLVDALVGFTHKVEHLDGREVVINVTGPVECEDIQKVKGEGMPRRSGNGKGDLFVTWTIDFPETLTEEQKKGIEKILRV